MSAGRPSKAALAERQLRAGDAAQTVFEKLLEPEDLVCPHCEEVIVAARYGNMQFQAARETMSAIGLGPMSRVKTEDDSRDLAGAIRELVETISTLVDTERTRVCLEILATLPEEERVAICAQNLPMREVLNLRE